jgi:hypothetical protein
VEICRSCRFLIKSADLESANFLSESKNQQIFELCRRVVQGWLQSADLENRQIFLKLCRFFEICRWGVTDPIMPKSVTTLSLYHYSSS